MTHRRLPKIVAAAAVRFYVIKEFRSSMRQDRKFRLAIVFETHVRRIFVLDAETDASIGTVLDQNADLSFFSDGKTPLEFAPQFKSIGKIPAQKVICYRGRDQHRVEDQHGNAKPRYPPRNKQRKKREDRQEVEP